MTRYIIKRLVLIPLTMLVIVLVLFALLYILPTSRIRLMPIYAGGDLLDSVFIYYNAGTNLLTQYIRYCYNIIFHFNFGNSSVGYALSSTLTSYIRNTVVITLSGIFITLTAGIPVGIYTATHNNSVGSRLITTISLLLSAIPTFAMALMVALVMVLYLGILPMATLVTEPISYIMPTLTIALCGISSIVRMTHASMLEVLDQPYITALRAKGLNEVCVLYRHSLKNALVPVISELGRFCSYLLCGAFVVEHFFNIPGLGYFMLRSVGERNHTEILGCTAVMSFLIILLNTVIDIVYMAVNPRIKLRYLGRKKTQEIQRRDV